MMKRRTLCDCASTLFDNLELSLAWPMLPSRVLEAQESLGVTTMSNCAIWVSRLIGHRPLDRAELTVGRIKASRREP